MVIANLFGNYDTARFVEGSTSGSSETGSSFTVTSNVYATALRWWRDAPGANRAPAYLQLWDAGYASRLIKTGAPADNGAAGWQRTALTTPIALIAGREYRISRGYSAGGLVYVYANQPPLEAPPAPFAWGPGPYVQSSPQDVYPATAYPTVVANIDIEVDDAVGGGVTPPATDPDVEADLANWFDPTDATHPLSDPKFYPRSVQSLVDWLNDTDGWLINRLNSASDGLVAILNWLGGSATQTGSVGGDTNAIYDGVIPKMPPAQIAAEATSQSILTQLPITLTVLQANIEAKIDEVILDIGNPVPHLVGWLQAHYHHEEVGTGFWALADEADFSGSFVADVAADAYVIQMLTWPTYIGGATLDGIRWLPRLGWYSFMDGGRPGDRHTLEWATSVLERLPARQQGLIAYFPHAVTGHWQAWVIS